MNSVFRYFNQNFNGDSSKETYPIQLFFHIPNCQTCLLGLEHAQELRATALLARADARSRVELGATQGRWQVVPAATDDVLLPSDVDIDAGSVTGDARRASDVRRLVHEREVPLRYLLLFVPVAARYFEPVPSQC